MKTIGCFPGRQFKNGTPIQCPDEKDLKPFTTVYHVWYMFVPFYFCAVGIAFYFPYTVFRHLSGIYDIKPMLNSLALDIGVCSMIYFYDFIIGPAKILQPLVSFHCKIASSLLNKLSKKHNLTFPSLHHYLVKILRHTRRRT